MNDAKNCTISMRVIYNMFLSTRPYDDLETSYEGHIKIFKEEPLYLITYSYG
jgi:hypothetical protein